LQQVGKFFLLHSKIQKNMKQKYFIAFLLIALVLIAYFEANGEGFLFKRKSTPKPSDTPTGATDTPSTPTGATNTPAIATPDKADVQRVQWYLNRMFGGLEIDGVWGIQTNSYIIRSGKDFATLLAEAKKLLNGGGQVSETPKGNDKPKEPEIKWVNFANVLPNIIWAIDNLSGADGFKNASYSGKADIIFRKAGYGKPKKIVANGAYYEPARIVEILYQTFNGFSKAYKATFLLTSTASNVNDILSKANLRIEKIGF
jgi:hypothetical protein